MDFSRGMLFHFAAIYLYYGVTICGILPFRYALNRFVNCEFQLLWSLCAGISIIALVGFSFYRIVTLITYPSLYIVRQLIYCEFIVRFGIISSCYVLAWIYRRQFKVCGNAFLENLKDLKPFVIPAWIDRKLVVYGLVKICIVDIMMSFLFAINFGVNASNDPVSLFERVVNVFAVFVVAQVSNVCMFTVYLGAHLYRLINWQVRLTIGMLCDLDRSLGQGSERAFQNRDPRLFDDVREKLALLRRLHYKTTQSIRGILDIFGVPLALINLNQFLVIISRVYFVYVSIIYELNKEFSITLSRYFNSIFYLCFEFIHLLCLVSACALTVRRAEKTLILLNEFFETDVDIAVDESLVYCCGITLFFFVDYTD
ncbi:uncharacterized protein LOC131681113 [Topomyia yanbarensis]|uniref:uncharacterized protein LOC131681113 n=1 Tax=Topomyia yanbarensis TaxID=2498891 RepID=UPI00273B7BD0|nr:uncharacterized protein LOC131681113 [Topomyia yanbarensis]